MPHHDEQLRKRLTRYYELAERASLSSALDHFNYLTIDCMPEPRPWREVARDWQWAHLRRLAPMFEHIAGIRKDFTGPYSYMGVWPKGSDKTSLVARLTNYALAFSTKPWRGYVAAADKDQAGYLSEAMATESSLNPWLRKRLSFRNWKVTGQAGAAVTILAADAPGSQGIRPDLLVLDEITHWHRPDLFHHLMSGRDKRPGSACIILTNAGVVGDWTWNVRELARTSPLWSFYEAPGPVASWMSPEAIEERRKMLPPSMARRLFDNVWTDPSESAGFLTRAEAQSAADLGVRLNLTRRTEGSPSHYYVGSIDYGPVRDRTVMTLVHQQDDLVIVDRMDVLEGKNFANGRVPVTRVEEWIDEVRKNYQLLGIVVDPYNLESVLQKYSGVAPLIRWTPRGTKANYEQAQALRSAVVNGKIAWYDGCGDVLLRDARHTLVDELAELLIVENASGYRMQHLPGKHDDRAVSLSMAVTHLLKIAPRRHLYLGEHFF